MWENLVPDIKTAAIICHARFLDLAAFGDILDQKEFRVRYYDAGQEALSFDADPDVLITLGGPVGAYELSDYPWIDDEMKLLSRHLRLGRPLLAICLGAQILAQSLGARVFKGTPEIGWAPIRLTEAGRRSELNRTGEQGVSVLHWHGDAFDLPVGALRLASTPQCENQAFSIGSALAVQFHPEVRARDFERWLICNTGQIASLRDHSVASLREQARLYADAAAGVGQVWFSEWLDRANITTGDIKGESQKS
jgi:GMP synthase (glutamine-hydrolysing)